MSGCFWLCLRCVGAGGQVSGETKIDATVDTDGDRKYLSSEILPLFPSHFNPSVNLSLEPIAHDPAQHQRTKLDYQMKGGGMVVE